jgi:hypothetical protein
MEITRKRRIAQGREDDLWSRGRRAYCRGRQRRRGWRVTRLEAARQFRPSPSRVTIDTLAAMCSE